MTHYVINLLFQLFCRIYYIKPNAWFNDQICSDSSILYNGPKTLGKDQHF